MFNFFKRSDKDSSGLTAKPSASAKKARSSSGGDFLEPLPMPEVQEGNLDSDWAMWEDSVLEQEVHPPEVRPPAQYADTTPSSLEHDGATDVHDDPFSKVTKNRP
ncbi:MAG: hypothetical protein HYX43_19815 [Burkholderiales bacterium]|nr:hypothetical protein [Burkholderiales bacterium]